METSDNLFLLFSFITDGYASKPLIKKLYGSLSNFNELFTDDTVLMKSKLKYEEIENIKSIKNAIQKFNLNDMKKILEKHEIKYVAFCDKDYPQKLKELSDPPFVLFYKGNIDLIKVSKSVAIVGTRTATNYGKNISKKIASFIAEQSIVVISGLASGIDTSAHLGAKDLARTIAVVGTGLDIVFPSSNKDLFNEMLDKGNLIVSEYPPGTEGAPWNFPQRNRIISALSDAVIVTEGDLQSGALITARFAIKQGKPLFALPGPIDSPMSNGPNILIKSKSAELLTSVQDIFEALGETKQVKINFKEDDVDISELNEKQKTIYKILSSEPKNFDSILSETGLEVQDITMNLSVMELKGFIEKSSRGDYEVIEN
ncbi:MAG: DNA protecting protein DprA [Candidatus Melainabacteria bacterium RIFCSPHIGHO2_02_FULL_34_12]|nr:MAG: DNA protecting protein DprA [Candidatus Melainabacteria bacterium RIFCSPHIGHO2_02_FULL_34_12]